MPDITKYLTVRVAPGINLNAVGDTQITVPYGQWVVDFATTQNASTSLAATSATLGLYTAPAAGGTAIVAAATGSLTPLTGAPVFNKLTTTNTTILTSTILYIRVGVAHGSAATCDVQLTLKRMGF